MAVLLRVRALLLTVGALLVAGCGAPGLGDAGLIPGASLPTEGGVLLMEPSDARDTGDRVVAGSASSAAVALRADLESRGFELLLADGGQRAAALAEAAELRCPLVMEVEFLGWNEAGLEWRDEPDRVELRLRVYSVPEGQLLAWAHGEREGASVADKVSTAHRMLEPLLHDLLEPIFDGRELSEAPELDD